MHKNRGGVVTGGLIALGVVAIVGGVLMNWVITGINTMRVKDEIANQMWAQVDNQLQRRYDLIPNLVNTVKGYAAHEDKVLEGVAQARAAVGQAKASPNASAATRVAAEGELTQALGRLLVVTENYPQLKADKHFTALMDELANTENRIAVARMDYNAAVKAENELLRILPTSLLAGPAGVQRRPYFETSADARKNVDVKF